MSMPGGHPIYAQSARGEWWEVLLLALAALLLFHHLFGFASLDPHRISWMLQGDPAQHYLGWQFFRNEAWQWPPGRIATFGLPAGTSIVFTDSIPLLALLLKPFNSLLPNDFQYFGLWILGCYLLNGLAALLLIRSFTPRLGLRLLVALFFMLSPPLMVRAYGHEALMAHGLLLLGFLGHLRHWSWPRWGFLLGVAALTHAYLLLMLLGIWATWVLRRAISWGAWRQGLLESLFILPGLFGLMYLAGYFVPGAASLAEGYGFFSMNMLAFVQPNFLEPRFGYSPLWAGPAVATGGQYEGYLYLGGGILLLAPLACMTLLMNHIRRQPIPPSTGIFVSPARWRASFLWLSLVSLVFWLLALSNHVTAGPHTLITLPLPDTMQAGLSVFRASGRFGWPLYYLLTLLILVVLIRLIPSRYSLPVLALALVVQLYELQPKHQALRQFIDNRHHAASPLVSPDWQTWAMAARRLLILPAAQSSMLHLEAIYIPFAQLAAQHQLSTNAAHTARARISLQEDYVQKAWKQLLDGKPDPQTLYVLPSEALLDEWPPQLRQALQFRDGYHILPPSLTN